MRRPLAVTVLAYFDIVMGGLAVYSVPGLLLLRAALGFRVSRRGGRSSRLAIPVLG